MARKKGSSKTPETSTPAPRPSRDNLILMPPPSPRMEAAKLAKEQAKRPQVPLFKSGNTMGSIPDHSKIEITKAAKLFLADPEYFEAMKRRVHAGQAPHIETLLWYYAFGKPATTVEVKRTDDELDLTKLTADELENLERELEYLRNKVAGG